MLQVALIGSGITGLSLVHHLRVKGTAQIELFHDGISLTKKTPGVVLGGSADLITRIASARGENSAKMIWRFGNLAHDSLVDFCKENGVTVKTGTRLHVAQNDMEAKELLTASHQLLAGGFSCHLEPSPFTDKAVVTRELSEIQSSSVVDLNSLLSVLTPSATKQEKVNSIHPDATGVTLEFASGKSVRSELVVLASHLASGDIYPYCKDWLVSYGDQWSLIEATGIPKEAVGSTVAWRFGYNRISFVSETQVVLTGGRTMRKGAAIGVDTIDFRQDICDRLVTEAEKIVPGLKLTRRLESVAALECRPCDELPLIGPIPGHDRVLIATGYMGHGLSLGFFAGKCLADFICHGRAPDLPDMLMPRRLRSLADS